MKNITDLICLKIQQSKKLLFVERKIFVALLGFGSTVKKAYKTDRNDFKLFEKIRPIECFQLPQK